MAAQPVTPIPTSKWKTDYVGQDLSKQKLYFKDFRYQDLTRARMRGSLFYNCNFDEANLTDADCEGSEFVGSTFRNSTCYQTNFRNAKLAATVFEPKDCFGMTITLRCATFTDMKVSQLWWFGWLIFATQMRPDRFPIQEQLLDNLIAMIGAERYTKLRALFEKRNI